MTAPAPVVDRAAREGLDALEGVARLGDEPASGSVASTPDPSRGRLRRLWFVPAGVALLGAAALVPSVGSSGPGAGEARVLVEGVAVVTDQDGETRTVRDDRVDVGPGDAIEVTEGRAVFEMAGDVRLEGLGRHDGRDGTTVEMAIAPRLVTGRLLAVAPVPLEIAAGGTVVGIAPTGSTEGAARLDRRLGLGVGTYRGQVTVDTAGRRADVPRYRRVEVAAPGALGRDGLPLRYEADDAWDRRFLGEALAIDAQVAPLLASLGAAERDTFLEPATLRDAMPGLPAGGGLADRLDEVDDGGAALVLAAIASVVDDRSFTTAWDRAAGFQGDGAPWGLAALDQGVRSSEVLPVLRAALDTLDLQAPTVATEGDATDVEEAAADAADGTADPAADGGATDPATSDQAGVSTTPDPPTDTDTGGGGGGGSGGGGSGGGGSGGPTVPTPTVPGVTIPTVPTVPTPTVPSVPEVVDDVGDTIDDVTDGVDGVVPGVGGLVDDLVGGLGGTVGGLGQTVADASAVADPVAGGLVVAVGQTLDVVGTGLGTALQEPAAA